MEKRGNILIENVVFIILTLVFFAAAFLTLYVKSSPEANLAEINAKKLVLMIDSSKPGSNIRLDFEEIFKIAEKNKISVPVIIDNKKNTVTVQLNEKAVYSYSFFNKAQVTAGKDSNFLTLEIR